MEKTVAMTENYVSVSEAASLLQCNASYIWRIIKAGKISSIKQGKLLIPLSEIEKLKEKNKKDAAFSNVSKKRTYGISITMSKEISNLYTIKSEKLETKSDLLNQILEDFFSRTSV